MRIRGKQIVLMVLAPLVLAACGGGDDADAGDAGSTNLPPIISGTPATSLPAGSVYTFTPTAADPEGQPITFNATNVPAWATFNPANGRLSGTPTEADVGMSGMITIEVSDSKSITQLPSFRIQVTTTATTPPPANTAPTIAGTPGTTATVGQTYTFTPVGNDVDGDTLTYQIDNRPTWAVFTSATGELRGTPAAGNVGTTSGIVIRVNDGTTTTALPAFNLQVVSAAPPVNRPPTITGTPATSVTAGTAYSFRPVASDPDGNTLTYSIQGQPSWAQFSTSTGRLSGTPGTANVGASARITISVSDGPNTVSLTPFTIQVNAPANRPPTISGTPLTSLTLGATYSFTPTASDPDNNPLTFRIDNMPSWATFNTTTGRLSGTPGLVDVLTFSNIVISVTDGTATVSLPAFAISVLQVATGSATVSWTPPTTNTDGSALINLQGYRVAYGRSQGALDQSATGISLGVSSTTINNLASGTWYFAVYAVNALGLESDISNIASKTIP
jgi:hypothetical protein